MRVLRNSGLVVRLRTFRWGGGGGRSADRLDRRRDKDPIAGTKLHAETDVDREWCDRTVVCRRTEEHGAPELREMVAAAHQYIPLLGAENDQLVYARLSTHDNLFPRGT